MLSLLATVAMAGSVYVNGVDVTGMTGQTFEGCTVVFDSQGNLQISAPGYEIQVQEAPTAPPPVPASPPAPQPATQAAAAVTAPPAPAPAGPAVTGVAPGQWWLVSDDSGSVGHTVDVFVKGALVQTIASGAQQVIFDLGPYLNRGVNRVHLQALSTEPSGGPLYVYLGSGDNASGTVMLDTPEIQFGLGPSRRGETSRDYTLDVP